MTQRIVVIVGAGALGSHVAMLMRSVPDITLRVVDYDRLEAKNVLAQFHAKAHVGRNKAEALKSTMLFLWGAKLETRPVRLDGINVDMLLGDADLVIDCVDNLQARAFISGFCRRGPESRADSLNPADQRPTIPLLHGALAADGQLGRVIWDERFVPDAAGEGAATCEGGDHLPFIGVVASWLAYAAQQFLLDGRKIGFQISPAAMARI